MPGSVLEGKKDKALPSNGETQTATCEQIRISDSDRAMEEKNNIKRCDDNYRVWVVAILLRVIREASPRGDFGDRT